MGIAYHGTHHKFDAFSLSAIGTGEGAQAYGWGLYFAGRREIAEYYKDAIPARHMQLDGVPLTTCPDDAERHRAWFLFNGWSSVDEAMNSQRDAVERRMAEGDTAQAQVEQATLEFMEEILPRITVDQGILYQVEIPDDSDLLDWDAPLAKQSRSVIAALRTIDIQDIQEQLQPFEMGASTGRSIYTALTRVLGNDDEPGSGSRAASMFLQSKGIPGMRYLDAESRKTSGGELLDVMRAETGKWHARIKRVTRPDDFPYNDPSVIESKPFDDETAAREWATTAISTSLHNYVIWDEAAVSVAAVNDELRQAEEQRTTADNEATQTHRPRRMLRP